MKLTLIDRYIIANQMRILSALNSKDAKYYEKKIEALEYGYEIEYKTIFQNFNNDGNTLTENECLEVIDILAMFSSLKSSYERLPDKSGIERWRIDFRGFDGNNETKQMGYAEHFCKSDGGKFTDLSKGVDFNSHLPSLDRYRSMLKVWKPLERNHDLTKEDIILISNS